MMRRMGGDEQKEDPNDGGESMETQGGYKTFSSTYTENKK
jgi:hypothetical protein